MLMFFWKSKSAIICWKTGISIFGKINVFDSHLSRSSGLNLRRYIPLKSKWSNATDPKISNYTEKLQLNLVFDQNHYQKYIFFNCLSAKINVSLQFLCVLLNFCVCRFWSLWDWAHEISKWSKTEVWKIQMYMQKLWRNILFYENHGWKNIFFKCTSAKINVSPQFLYVLLNFWVCCRFWSGHPPRSLWKPPNLLNASSNSRQAGEPCP